MLTVCAWCDRFMGTQGPVESHVHVTHGICPTCLAGQSWKDSPVLVVSRERASLAPVFTEILRGLPAVRVVVDRRNGERRRAPDDAAGGGERRAGPDRRRGTDVFLR